MLQATSQLSQVWCDVSPDVLVSLDVDLVELSVRGFSGNVRLHLHGHVTRQH